MKRLNCDGWISKSNYAVRLFWVAGCVVSNNESVLSFEMDNPGLTQAFEPEFRS
jgi:hypothetical protein